MQLHYRNISLLRLGITKDALLVFLRIIRKLRVIYLVVCLTTGPKPLPKRA